MITRANLANSNLIPPPTPVQLNQTTSTTSLTTNNTTSSTSTIRACKAYTITPLDDAAEELENEGKPDSDFFPKEGDSVESKEKGIRELHRRFGKRKAALEYDAELAAEAKQLRRMLGCEEEVAPIVTALAKKTQYHFTDQDGKIHISYIKDVTKLCFKKSMAFLRMMDPIRILELCTDDLHIVLDVEHAREWFLSRANLSVSSLPNHWASMELWNTVSHFPVMAPEKFSCLLLFSASYENIKKFSLTDFLRSSSNLNNIDMLKIALDNMQTVYHCIFGGDYKDICSVPKKFLQANIRILEIREFNFILDVFNKAFVNFQMDMRTRNIEVPNTTPLNSHELVVACFIKWFTFSTEMFTQETEDVYKHRPRFSLENGASKTINLKPINIKTTLSKKSSTYLMNAKPAKNPCIRHLASILGLQELAGINPVACQMGTKCRYAHYTMPLSRLQRKGAADYISTSTIGLLQQQTDRDLLLAKL